MLSAPRSRILLAALGAAALGATAFGIGFASAEPTEDAAHAGSTATTGDALPVSRSTSTTSAAPPAGSGGAPRSNTPDGADPGRSTDDGAALRSCLQAMGVPVPDPGATITIEITPVEGAPPTITVNGTVIEPTAALNALVACADELGGSDGRPTLPEDVLPELLEDLEQLDQPPLEALLDEWEDWLPPGVDAAQLEQDLEAFSRCLDSVSDLNPDAGPEATEAWADALGRCAAALHD